MQSEEFKLLINKWNVTFPHYPITMDIYDADTNTITNFFQECIYLFHQLLLPEGTELPRTGEDDPAKRLATSVKFLRSISKFCKVYYTDIIKKSKRRDMLISYTINSLLHYETLAPKVDAIIKELKNEPKLLQEEKDRLKKEISDLLIKGQTLQYTLDADMETYMKLIDEHNDLKSKFEMEDKKNLEKKEIIGKLANTNSTLKKQFNELQTKINLAAYFKDHSENAEENASIKTVLDEKLKCIEHYMKLLKSLEGFRDNLDKFSVSNYEIEKNKQQLAKEHAVQVRELKKELANLEEMIASLNLCDDVLKDGNEKYSKLKKYHTKVNGIKEELLERDQQLLKEKQGVRKEFVLEMRRCKLIQEQIAQVQEICESCVKNYMDLFNAKMSKYNRSVG